ncbi:MAG: hypothetical protein AMJ46_07215 [Latescibacteria bacterium DG_63]|nr:MAG: hypothetical protein AMJ46_07215 [Latescibacteria bacterium DG_63]
MSLRRIISVVAVVSLVLTLMWLGGCTEKSTGKPERDTTPPNLVSANAIDEIHVNVTFDEKLDEVSAEDAGNYTITPSLVYSEATSLLLVVSAVLLADEKNVLLETDPQIDFGYILEVSGVKDLAGNAMEAQTTDFTGTTQGDTTAPVVTGTIPADDARDVDTLTTVTIEFSECMNTSSVEGSFGLVNANDLGYSIPGSFSWEANDARAIFTATEALEDLSMYYASIGTGAMDVSGNPFESEYPWSFVTGNGGAITGTVTYSPLLTQGVTQVSGPVFIGLFDTPCLTEPVMEAWSESLGPYTVDPVPPGTYYVASVLDVNDNGEVDIGEPAGMYDTDLDTIPDPVVVVAGKTTGGIDISLDYEFRLCTISGTITKSPDVTESDTTYVFFFMEDPTAGEEVDLVGYAIVPDGTGPYTSTPLRFGCYYIICFMDLNGNGELDFVGDVPAEPVAVYGELPHGGGPVLIPVFVVDDVTGVDMELINYPYATVPPLSASRARDITSLRGTGRGFAGTR